MPALRAVLQRALALDPKWESGAIHEAMIALEGLPPLLGGSPVRAREHFDKSVQLSGGQSAFAYVTLATSVAQPAKDRAEFERLLRAALAVDVSKRPSLRLAEPDCAKTGPHPAGKNRNAVLTASGRTRGLKSGVGGFECQRLTV